MSLQNAILVLLETEEGSGYDLLKRFQGRMGYFWNASHQQIYQQLKKMNEQGLIQCQLEKQQAKPDRKVYTLTDDGRQSLLDWMHSPIKPSKINDALLLKLYAGHMVESVVIATEISLQRVHHQKMLDTFLGFEQEYLQLSDDKKAPYKLPYITLRRGILGEQAWLTWADEVAVLLTD
jgi:PadR family transcriptional regulator AphA